MLLREVVGNISTSIEWLQKDFYQIETKQIVDHISKKSDPPT